MPRFTSATRMLMVILLVVLTATPSLLAQPALNLPKPGDRQFVQDLAGLLNREQTEQVKKLADELLTQTAIPLIVVAIERKSDYGGGNMSIETFARTLYEQWDIGQIKLGDKTYNRGILLVVARSDREARIELGGGYGSRMDSDALWIMDNRIVPRFKADDYGGGIVAGSVALAEMARGELKTSGLMVQMQQTPWWHFAIAAGVVVLAAFTAISLHLSGRHGWAWVFWGVALVGLWWIVRAALSNKSSGGGGGFGGGSFGGGSSGGGGASGRW